MKISKDEILLINALQNVAGVSAIDCIIKPGEIVYVVNEGQLSRAIGKKGETVQRLRKKLAKNVSFFEAAKTPEEFLKKAFHKVAIGETAVSEVEGKKVLQLNLDFENRQMLLAEGSKLRNAKELVKRHFGIEEIRLR